MALRGDARETACEYVLAAHARECAGGSDSESASPGSLFVANSQNVARTLAHISAPITTITVTITVSVLSCDGSAKDTGIR